MNIKADELQPKIQERLAQAETLFACEIDIENEYKQIKNRATKTKLSVGAKSINTYGLFPPQPYVDVLYTNRKYGHITSKSDCPDFIYYFGDDGKILLTERYSIDKTPNYMLLNIVFFEYDTNCITTYSYHCASKTITTIEQCYFNENKMPSKYIQYLRSSSNSDIEFRETSYRYENNDVQIQYELYFCKSYLLPPMYAIEEYIYHNGKLTSTAPRQKIYI